jgi:hypothetical protein
MKVLLKMLVAVAAIAAGTQAHAQERAGVVTTLEGNVTVSRAALPQPAPLRFKDDIFVRDRIATSKDSIARILLGGRAVVTVREHSTVTITEAPGVATVDVATGRVAVAVAREKMRPGDVLQVKTPNAVAGIRGTVIVAEVFDANHSVITVLKGTIDVRRREAGGVVGAAVIVNALQRVSVTGDAPLSGPQAVAPAAARELGQEFKPGPPRGMPPAVNAAISASAVDHAAKELAALPRRIAVDRRGPGPLDDDADDVVQDSRSGPTRERPEKPVKPDTGVKAKLEGSALRGTDPVGAITDAGKSSDRSGRRGRDRDR